MHLSSSVDSQLKDMPIIMKYIENSQNYNGQLKHRISNCAYNTYSNMHAYIFISVFKFEVADKKPYPD